MKHQTAKLFEPKGRVFGRRVMSLSATVEDIEHRHALMKLPPFLFLDTGLRRYDEISGFPLDVYPAHVGPE